MAKKKNKAEATAQNTRPAKPQGQFSFDPYLKYAPLFIVLLFLVFFFPLLFKSYYLWEDVIEQHYPNAVYTMASLKSGEIPQWTPFVFGGMPYMADMQTGLFYPPNWILFLAQTTADPGGGVFIWFILLHILIFGLGIFALSRSFGLSVPVAFYTATGSMFCGFISTHVIHIIFLYVIAWFPLSFLFLKKAYENNSLKNLGIASLFFGISILGGYAQYTLFLSCVLGLYTCFFAFENRNRGTARVLGFFAMFGLFMALAAGLALVQLLPTFELSAESVRTNMTWDQSIEGSLSFPGLITFLAPKFYGWITGMTEVSQASGGWMNGSPYWGGSGQHIFWETACFVGILPIILYAAGFPLLRKDKRFIFFSILSGLAFLLALGNNGPLYYIVFHFVPGFGNFRHPGRFSFVFAFAFIMASGLALESLLNLKPGESDKEKRAKKAAYIVSGIILAVLLFSLTILSGLDEAKKSCAQQAVGFAVFSTLASCWIIFLLFRARSKTFPALLAALYVFVELYLFGSAFGEGKATGKDVFRPDPQIDAIRAEVEKNPFRLQGRIFEGEGKGIRLFGHLNLGNVYRIPIVEGYNQLHLGRLSRFLHEAQPKKEMDLFNVKFRARTDGRGFYIAPDTTFCRRFSLRSDIRIAADGDDAIRIINGDAFNPLTQATVEEPLQLSLNPAFPPDSLGSVVLKSYAPHQISVEVNARVNCLLFASEVFYPAWKAKLDGKDVSIHKTNFLFRGVEIPEGRHEVVFEYKSGAFAKGKIVSPIVLLVVLLMIFIGDKIRIKRQESIAI